MAGIRMTGMTSGLDTESIVQAMVMSTKNKKEKVEKSKTKLEWSQEIWKNTNSKIYSLYTGLDKVRFSGNFKNKKTTVSDTSKANITAGSSATNGTQTLRITQLSKTGYLTGAKLKSNGGSAVDGDTRLSDLGVEDSSISIKTGDGTKTIDISKDMTVKEFTSKLNDSGVSASFDAGNSRFFISAKAAGKDADFTLTGNGDAGQSALSALGLVAKTEADVSKLNELKSLGTFKADGSLSEAATKKDIKAQFSELQERYFSALEDQVALNDQISPLVEQRDADADTLATRKEIANYLSAKKNVLDGTATEEEANLVSSLEEQNANNPSSLNKDMKYYIDEANKTDSEGVGRLYNYNNKVVDRYDTQVNEASAQIDELYKQLNSVDEEINDIKNEAKENPLFAAYADSLETADASEVASAGLSTIKSAIADLNSENSDGATRVNGQDAEIYLNGARFTSNSNTFEINGMTINATGLTGDDEISITTSTDVDAVYDKFKDFLDQYNTLVNELQGLYNADANKDYQPLTEDEKAEMSDTDIEKWETKIKDSLLRRDTTLRSVISTMTTSMAQSYDVKLKDGTTQKMALSSVGVHTLGFLNAKTNEQYAYHIDGDEDDTNTSAKTDKLRAFIESDPDAAADLFSQVAQGLYKALDTKVGMTISETSSAFTVYNDKQMKTQLDTYKKQIKTWEEKLEDQEDMYYKRFAAMEKALTNINGNQSALSGLLG